MPTSAPGLYTQRASNYSEGRPDYPLGVVEVLRTHGVTPGAVVIDLGSGTGAMSRLLAGNGYRVVAVEPNAAMRGVALLGGAGGVAALAEVLPFDDHCVDAVVVAQALHWFDPEPSTRSIWQVLRPRTGVLVGVWNERRVRTPFEHEVEAALLRDAPDYGPSRAHDDAGAVFERFAAGHRCRTDEYANFQDLDEDRHVARFLSPSWAPPPGTQQAARLRDELVAVFARHGHAGRVRLGYRTVVLSTVPGSTCGRSPAADEPPSGSGPGDQRLERR